MKNTMNKRITIIILLLALMMVVSGCIKKQQESVVNNKTEPIATTTEPQILPEEVINYLENGEIDVSDWRTYKNQLGFTMKYPIFLETRKDDTYSKFGFQYAVNRDLNKNWWIYCGVSHPSHHLFDYDYKERIKSVKSDVEKKYDYQYYEYNNGVGFYWEDDMRKGFNTNHYSLNEIILSKNNLILSCNINLTGEEVINNELENNRYGKVFQAMLKSIVLE